MLYRFPTPDDRAAVETAVKVFLQAQRPETRDQMLRTARAVLDRYKIKKLSLSKFYVEATSPGLSAIRGKLVITGLKCPECGANIYQWPGKVRIISIQEGMRHDVVTYGCSCGSVFRKHECNQ